MGPLQEIKVIELEGLAPVPFCGMMLADFGARVLVVKRPGLYMADFMEKNPLYRGKLGIKMDLKDQGQKEIFVRMIRSCDVLLDPYRPGVMERLGLGPEALLNENPRLVYARVTGYGQTGPYKSLAGHDINYLALAGALSLFQRPGERPLPPMNILADFAGGGLMAAFGVALALFERERSGRGQVIDISMTDSVNYLITFVYGLYYNGLMTGAHGTNRLDGGAPYYQVYETKDGRFISVGAIEPQFYHELLKALELDPDKLPHQEDVEAWQVIKAELARVFKGRTRDEWWELFKDRDACVAPVLELWEVGSDPHHKKRERLKEDSIPQPNPAPIFSRTPGRAGDITPTKKEELEKFLADLGLDLKDIQALLEL